MKLITIVLAALSAIAISQDKPIDIPKKGLPAKGVCLMCVGEGEEKLAGGVAYKGKNYYFCNTKEIAAFKKDPEAHVPPILPRPVPAFSIMDTAGKAWDADAMKGKLVLVDFWATWCGPCKAMFPLLDKLHARYKDKGFELLSVSVDQRKGDLDKFLKSHRFPNPILHDTTQTFAKWGVKAIPASFLVKDGQIVAQWTGVVKEKDLAAAIEEHLPSK